jgi:hypothetical protein
MPANFGEIANYHHRLAAQHMELARVARDAGDLNAAEYNRQLAARYIEAAEEQKTVMSQAPGYATVNQAPRRRALQANPAPKPVPKPALEAGPKPTPLAASCFSAIRRGAGSVAATLQQSLSHANASLQSLSFRDTPPAPAPQLRG